MWGKFSLYFLDERSYLPGSVRQNAAICSPVASLGRYFAFCSSFPAIKIPWNTNTTVCYLNTLYNIIQHSSYWTNLHCNNERLTFRPIAWCAASVTAMAPSKDVISPNLAYIVLDRPSPPGKDRQTDRQLKLSLIILETDLVVKIEVVGLTIFFRYLDPKQSQFL